MNAALVVPADLPTAIGEWQARGASVLYVVEGRHGRRCDRTRGRDPTRVPCRRSTQLHAHGVHVVMITGDAEQVADRGRPARHRRGVRRSPPRGQGRTRSSSSSPGLTRRHGRRRRERRPRARPCRRRYRDRCRHRRRYRVGRRRPRFVRPPCCGRALSGCRRRATARWRRTSPGRPATTSSRSRSPPAHSPGPVSRSRPRLAAILMSVSTVVVAAERAAAASVELRPDRLAPRRTEDSPARAVRMESRRSV